MEALKDQADLCCWIYALRSLQQRSRGRFGALSQAARGGNACKRKLRNQRRHFFRSKCSDSRSGFRTENERPCAQFGQENVCACFKLIESTWRCSRIAIGALAQIVMKHSIELSLLLVLPLIIITASGIDQAGLCRRNYALRSFQQQARGRFRAFSQAAKSSSVVERRKSSMEEKAKRSEEALRTVMYLSCWGPN